MMNRRERRAAKRHAEPMVNDLGDHLSQRVSACFMQTLALLDGNPEQQFVVATMGLGAAFGFTAGVYAAMTGKPLDVDPLDLAETILAFMREGRERGT